MEIFPWVGGVITFCSAVALLVQWGRDRRDDWGHRSALWWVSGFFLSAFFFMVAVGNLR
ncbi:hypothetical protein [Actinomadura parmotrematis]|uniref:Uncharacterized protein n=1 Tax=Actinomadura parmotrematis TaxID=2864039 RepID=A0ABS7FU89_9ACTN|nr:hypothetical protein [Actinomadura parmotrematis]MBW8483977.1 hypothetical protein [Actinomadura parmotrematis]